MPETTPNTQLTAWREANYPTRAEMVEALCRTAAAIELGLVCDEERLRRWERGEVLWPHPPYLRALHELTGRSAEQLGFIPPAKQKKRARSRTSQSKTELFDLAELSQAPDISNLRQWITTSDTSDEAIARLARSTSSLPHRTPKFPRRGSSMKYSNFIAAH